MPEAISDSVSAAVQDDGRRRNGHQGHAGRKRPCLAVLVGVFFRRMFVVFGGVQMMTMRNLGVMRRLFMIASFVMFCRLAMVFRGLGHDGVPTSHGAHGSRVPAFFSRKLFDCPDARRIAGVDELFATCRRVLHGMGPVRRQGSPTIHLAETTIVHSLRLFGGKARCHFSVASRAPS